MFMVVNYYLMIWFWGGGWDSGESHLPWWGSMYPCWLLRACYKLSKCSQVMIHMHSPWMEFWNWLGYWSKSLIHISCGTTGVILICSLVFCPKASSVLSKQFIGKDYTRWFAIRSTWLQLFCPKAGLPNMKSMVLIILSMPSLYVFWFKRTY